MSRQLVETIAHELAHVVEQLREVQRIVFAQLRALLDASQPNVAVTSGRIH